MGRDFEPPCFLPVVPCPAPGVIILKGRHIALSSFISATAVSDAATAKVFVRTMRWSMTLKESLKLSVKTARLAVYVPLFAPQTPC